MTRLEGRSVMFISYNEMLGGLGQSQVIPYLRVLHHAEGVRFTLLSYEKPEAFTPEGERRCAALKEQLAADGLEWHFLRYHQRPSLPATMYDVLAGTAMARKLIKRNRVEMIHARSHIPAAIALPLKKRFNLKLLFDLRGLMAEEYADAGHWRPDSALFRLTKSLERRAFASADGLVTLTEAIWPHIKDWPGLRGRELPRAVIPCCADLAKFNTNDNLRAARRAALGVENRFVIVYSGSLDGWYLTAEMADFCAAAAKTIPAAFFLWLTPTRHERVRALMRERGLGEQRHKILALPPAEVASHLAAADAGLAFIKPCFSKIASSPTKTAEYLGCGLPLILNAGIGDSDALTTQENAGALVSEYTPAAYSAAAQTVWQMAQDAATRPRMRDLALRFFDLQTVGRNRYAQLYREILSG
jgi:glycosyltransferase involved in cell wall biosynthesis